jgi:NAD-dependent deacetylase
MERSNMDGQQILTSVSDELKEKIRKALLVGRGIGIFAGAGISVLSGIKTFRGLNQMDYFEGYPPTYLCTMEMFKKSPKVCWEFFKHLYSEIKEAEPSTVHKILANWQSKYKNRPNSFCIITSNFDGLLSKAGVDPVYELHGNINIAKCLSCGKSYDMNSLNLEELPPRCECGEILKPNITLLNDYVDQKAYDQAMRISCAFYFCIGTSGVNHHAANFLQMVKDKKMATLIEINPRATNLTKDMDYVLRGNVEDILPQF